MLTEIEWAEAKKLLNNIQSKYGLAWYAINNSIVFDEPVILNRVKRMQEAVGKLHQHLTKIIKK